MASPQRFALVAAIVIVAAACTSAEPAPTTTSTTTTTLAVAIRTSAASPLSVDEGVDEGVAAAVRDEIDELRSTTESLRGLGFLGPPPIAVVDRPGFAARWEQLVTARLAESGLDAENDLMHLLGLLGRGEDLAGLTQRNLPAPQTAFYDPLVGELVVVAEPLDLIGRNEVVRELVRILTDQYHGHTDRIAEMQAAGDADGADALSTLALADALYTELRYVAGLPADEQRQVAERRVTVAGGPDFLVEELAFVGDAGVAFVAALLDAGGTAALDAAYGAALTTESILHPRRFLGGEGILELQIPDVNVPGYTVSHAGPRGELGLRSMLAAALLPGVLTQTADGWGADYEIVLRSGDRVAYGYLFRGDGPEDAFEVAQAFLDHATFVMGMAEPVAAGGGVEFVGLAEIEATAGDTTTTVAAEGAAEPAGDGPYVFVDRTGERLVVVVADDPVAGRRLRAQLS